MARIPIGVAANSPDARQVVAAVRDLERRGINAAWLTTGGAGLDGLTLLAAAAARTERVRLGTSITPTWPRHPIVATQQAQVIAQLAPGRFRVGVGPSHRPAVEGIFGFKYEAPVRNLREYVTVARRLLRDGNVDFSGKVYKAAASIARPLPDVPVMASALREASYEVCGELADGAISWVSPHAYLRDKALPALRAGAARAGRPAPPLVAHVPVCVHGDVNEVRAAVREQLATYPRSFNYQEMFAASGHPEAREGTWSNAMIDAVVVSGGEEQVAMRLRELSEWGFGELLVTVVPAGADAVGSRERALSLLAEVAKAR
ncbi:MAG: LLM class flavin-dependent oxidoreductase [SAR202 cluster bacterium]|nr:LLM class flavin-dependent oxidoreductase [SAR202 cluster bacterium]